MQKNIASERVRRGLTQRELADELGVSPSTVTTWERGEGLSTKNLVQLADFFGCSIDYLLDRTDTRVLK